MLNGTPIGLPSMLAAREQRAAQQLVLRQKYQSPQLSFGLNIPGPVKSTPALRQLFDQTCLAIRDSLTGLSVTILDSQTLYAPTGNEYLLAFDGDAAAVKATMTRLEERTPLGRLFDIDILTTAGVKLSRSEPRRCLLCKRQAQDCARSRRHSVEELTIHIEALLTEYLP